MRIHRSKKGISPLIATVLLIAFAVALGAVVMNISQGYLSEGEEPASCDGASISVFEAKGKKDVCFEQKTIKYRLSNSGTSAISNVRVQAVGTNAVAEGILGSSLDPADIERGSMSYSIITYGDLLKIRFIPQTGSKLCQNAVIEVDSVGNC